MIRDLRKNPFPTAPVIEDDDIEIVLECLRTGKLSQLTGTYVNRFAQEFAEYHGVGHCVPTNSGTTALHTAIIAADIGPGDEVITSPNTFIASDSAVLMNDAVPVFSDVDPMNYTLDPDDVKEKVTKRTRAIMVVHIGGHMTDMDPIMEIAEDHNLTVIEDCAQSIGAEYKGRKAGTMGDIGTYSFWDNKNMGTGEGGALVTNDDKLADRARRAINHFRPNYDEIGYNYRMPELCGALAITQLRKIDRFNTTRQKIAEYYMQEFKGLEGLNLPSVLPNCKYVWYHFCCTVDEKKLGISRDELLEIINSPQEFPGIGEAPWQFIASPYRQRPEYANLLFINRRGRGKTKVPFVLKEFGHDVKYFVGMCPNAEKLCSTYFDVFINHAMSMKDAGDILKGVKLGFSKI